MTREEAIDLIKLAKAEIEWHYSLEYQVAFDMAIKALEQEPCEDCISRKAVEKITWEEPSFTDALNVLTEVRDKVRALPSVTPQLKTGHWIDIMVGDMPAQACDQCKTFYPLAYTGGGHKYCPNCGCRMIKPQENVRNKE